MFKAVYYCISSMRVHSESVIFLFRASVCRQYMCVSMFILWLLYLSKTKNNTNN